jgi:hypothetical protein
MRSTMLATPVELVVVGADHLEPEYGVVFEVGFAV